MLMGSLVFSSIFAFGEPLSPDRFRPAPKRMTVQPDVIVEWMDTSGECPADSVCADAQLFNAGKSTAYNVSLRVEIGNMKLSKPRAVLRFPVETKTMAPGDRQLTAFVLSRRITVRERNKDRTVEVGKYNFHIVPVWTDTPVPPASQKKTKARRR